MTRPDRRCREAQAGRRPALRRRRASAPLSNPGYGAAATEPQATTTLHAPRPAPPCGRRYPRPLSAASTARSRRARVSHLARSSSTCHSGSRTGAGGDAAGGGGRAGRDESACWGSNGAATSNRSGEPHTRQMDRNWYSLASSRRRSRSCRRRASPPSSSTPEGRTVMTGGCSCPSAPRGEARAVAAAMKIAIRRLTSSTRRLTANVLPKAPRCRLDISPRSETERSYKPAARASGAAATDGSAFPTKWAR